LGVKMSARDGTGRRKREQKSLINFLEPLHSGSRGNIPFSEISPLYFNQTYEK
jgi:hypothetical protein